MNEGNNSSSLAIYLRLLKYLKGKLGLFALSIIGFLIYAASQPALAKLMELVIESIENKDTDTRALLPLIAISIFLIRGVGYFLGNYFNEYVGAAVIKDVKLVLFKHLTSLPASFYDSSSQGEILHKLHNSVTRLQTLVTGSLKTLIREGLTVIALTGYVFYLNWKLSLIFLLVAPLLGLMVSITGKRFRKIARKNEGALGKAMQVSKELIGNYGVVRSFGAQDYESARYASAVERAFKTQLKITQVASIFTPATQLVIASAVALIIYLLLNPVNLAENSTGDLIGYLTAVALLPKSIRQLSGLSVTIQRGLVGAEMIFNLLDTEPEKDKGELELNETKGKIEVKNLNFKYPKSKNLVLKDISFEVEPGEMVALVGHSGGGKSSLASLLYRLYDIDDGTIFLDGTDINKIKLSNLRQHIAAVNQDISLFDDTVRKNIAYGHEEIPDDRIIKALEAANADKFVLNLPKGLDTEIGENGLSLSGGQRQRLSLARAFLKDAPVLILDEATSSLDNESESIITNALDDLAKSRTTIVIAHRLSTIVKADRLLVISDGEIVESGTHAELLSKGGAYSQLYQSEYK